jgi:hypothetical protein
MQNTKNDFITKTMYREYLKCPKNTWLKLNKAELQELFSLSEFDKNLVRQGVEVELLAQKLFPQAINIENMGGDPISITKQHIQQQVSCLFQPTFIFDKFLARNDVLEFDHITGRWDLYEIKATNSLEENKTGPNHIDDVSFQVAILQKNEVKIGKIFIIHLNNDYIRSGEIDINQLLIKEDVTEKVMQKQQQTLLKMEQAKIDLFQTSESSVFCPCIYRGRSSQCETFKYTHKHIPEYSVHDLVRIGSSRKKLAELIDKEILNIEDIPEHFDLSIAQKNQVAACRLAKTFIDTFSIREELSKLHYPLYFLDYETYAPSIPMFDAYKPYQQIPFQFSLYRVNTFGDKPVHSEYLHISDSDPSMEIIKKLRESIGSRGTIIVWYKGFEQMINAQLGDRHPEHKEFLSDLNARIYDLMEIFSKQFYVHPDFRGKTSIKRVLPVLIPELNYADQNIKDGTSASQNWYDMVFNSLSDIEKECIANSLKSYCALDTYAMYAIWSFLMTNVNANLTSFEECVTPQIKIDSISI